MYEERDMRAGLRGGRGGGWKAAEVVDEGEAGGGVGCAEDAFERMEARRDIGRCNFFVFFGSLFFSVAGHGVSRVEPVAGPASNLSLFGSVLMPKPWLTLRLDEEAFGRAGFDWARGRR